MDGQNRTKLVDSKIVFPHGITLDLVNRLVYWADAYLDYVEVVDYEGKNRHTIIQGLLVRTNTHTHIHNTHTHTDTNSDCVSVVNSVRLNTFMG